MSLLGLLLWGSLAFARPTDEAVLKLLEPALKGRGDRVERTVTRAGELSYRLESKVSFEGDFAVLKSVVADVPRYKEWMLKGVNNRPEGGQYKVRVDSLEMNPKVPGEYIIQLTLDFPFLTRQLTRTMRFEPEITSKRALLHAELPHNGEALVGSATADVWFFPAPGEKDRIWAYTEGKVTLTNWLLYEAMPSRLLTREAGERIFVVLENYLAEESRRLRSNQSPKEKTAGPGE